MVLGTKIEECVYESILRLYSLRCTIFTAFALIVLLTSVSIWCTVFFSGQATIELSTELTSEQFRHRIVGFLGTYLGLGEKALRVIRDAYTQRWIIPFPQPVDYVTNLTEQAIIRLSFFNIIYHIRVAKLFLGREYDNTSIGVENLNANTASNTIDRYGFILTYNNTRYSYVMNESNPLQLDYLLFFQEFNPRDRPWYKLGENITDIAITDPYIDAAGLSYTLTLVGPLKNPNGTLYGVIAIDYFFQDLSEYLTNFDAGSQYDVHIMILANDGDIIATSHGQAVTYINGIPQRVKPQHVNDSILQEAYWRALPYLSHQDDVMIRYKSRGTI